ncbi:MAG: hypothetical protein KDD32_01205 [Bacteroidetes bacterium]|nr:hypothetical protein [Bacteroidota bacterium]
MNSLECLKKIEDHLEKIHQINKEISASGQLSVLESDLVKEHLRRLYELYNELTGQGAQSTHSFAETDTEASAEPFVAETKPTELIENEVLKSLSPEMDNKEEAAVILQSKLEDIPEPNIEKEVSTEDSTISLFEKYEDQPEKKQEQSTSKTSKPIKQLIGLNDKFTFIKVLFGNSVAKYDEVIAKVDAMNSKKEALQFFESDVWKDKEFEEKEELVERVEAILDAKFN